MPALNPHDHSVVHGHHNSQLYRDLNTQHHRIVDVDEYTDDHRDEHNYNNLSNDNHQFDELTD